MSKRNFVFALAAIFLTLSFPSAGAAADENSPDRNSARVLRVLLFRPRSKHFANGCASLAMSKEKTFSLSTDVIARLKKLLAE